MAIIASNTYKVNYPDSDTYPAAVEYEYFLIWKGTDGGVYWYLFTDWEVKERITGENINTDNEFLTRKFKKSENSIVLSAEDVSEVILLEFKNLLRAEYVARYDGTDFVPVAIVEDSIQYRKTGTRYDFTFEIQIQDSNLF